MSNLLVQNIKHTNGTTAQTVDSSGQVNVRGEGSATTTNLQQGLCKSWHQCDENTALDDSFNTASIVDDATGIHTVTFTSNMGNADYTGGVCARLNSDGGNAFLRFSNSFTTSQNKFVCVALDGTLIDAETRACAYHGDLA
tara:strand:+ start:123 stop:545 length:423 start_codon:yes stop_codon:yes gene_type:complete